MIANSREVYSRQRKILVKTKSMQVMVKYTDESELTSTTQNGIEQLQSHTHIDVYPEHFRQQ